MRCENWGFFGENPHNFEPHKIFMWRHYHMLTCVILRKFPIFSSRNNFDPRFYMSPKVNKMNYSLNFKLWNLSKQLLLLIAATKTLDFVTTANVLLTFRYMPKIQLKPSENITDNIWEHYGQKYLQSYTKGYNIDWKCHYHESGRCLFQLDMWHGALRWVINELRGQGPGGPWPSDGQKWVYVCLWWRATRCFLPDQKILFLPELSQFQIWILHTITLRPHALNAIIANFELQNLSSTFFEQSTWNVAVILRTSFHTDFFF